MVICKEEHRYMESLENLPEDQGGTGRHRCAGCAYDRGRTAGEARQDRLDLDIDSLPECQAGTVRHRSVHAAFALGYYDGVLDILQKKGPQGSS